MQEFLAGVGVAAVAASGWFGNFVGNFRPVNTERHPSEMTASTTKPMKGGAEKVQARPGVKASSACIGAAVTTREKALAAGVRTFGTAIADAYDDRADALAVAYAKTGDETVRASLKTSWDSFKTSDKTARDTWNGTQRAAWKAFEASVKACGGTSVTDSANASADVMPAPVI